MEKLKPFELAGSLIQVKISILILTLKVKLSKFIRKRPMGEGECIAQNRIEDIGKFLEQPREIKLSDLKKVWKKNMTIDQLFNGKYKGEPYNDTHLEGIAKMSTFKEGFDAFNDYFFTSVELDDETVDIWNNG